MITKHQSAPRSTDAPSRREIAFRQQNGLALGNGVAAVTLAPLTFLSDAELRGRCGAAQGLPHRAWAETSIEVDPRNRQPRPALAQTCWPRSTAPSFAQDFG